MTNFDSKKWSEEMFFLGNQSINVFYPSKKNDFVVPNHEKKGDYYENPHLSHSRTNFTFKENGRKESFLNE